MAPEECLTISLLEGDGTRQWLVVGGGGLEIVSNKYFQQNVIENY